MLKCQECGELLSPMAVSCPVCGTPVPRAQQAASVSPVAAPQPVASMRQPADQNIGDVAQKKSKNPLPYIIGGVLAMLLICVIASTGLFSNLLHGIRLPDKRAKAVTFPDPYADMVKVVEYSGVGGSTVGPFTITGGEFGCHLTTEDSTNGNGKYSVAIVNLDRDPFFGTNRYDDCEIGKDSNMSQLNGLPTAKADGTDGKVVIREFKVESPVPTRYTIQIISPPTMKWTAKIYQK